MPDMTSQMDWGQAIPCKREKPVRIFCLHKSEKSKPALLFWKLWEKVKSKIYLSEPHKKKYVWKFFSSMSRTISPDLRLNLSFYVDLASDFEIIPLAKNKRIFFRFEIDSKQYLSSCSSKCLVHPRSYIHIHFRIWIKLKFMYQQTRKVMFHPISITRQADWNKPRRSKDFWRPPNRMKNWIVFCAFSQMSNFSWRNSKL